MDVKSGFGIELGIKLDQDCKLSSRAAVLNLWLQPRSGQKTLSQGSHRTICISDSYNKIPNSRKNYSYEVAVK